MKKAITSKRLYNIALFYLSKYEASRKQVADMLRRRVAKARLKGIEVPADADEMIAQVIEQLTAQHYVSDKRFAENRAYHWGEQGKSASYIALKLKQAGIDADTIRSVLENGETSELDKARQYVMRKKLGYLRPESERLAMRQKDLARLARQGFSLDVALQALGDEYIEEDGFI